MIQVPGKTILEIAKTPDWADQAAQELLHQILVTQNYAKAVELLAARIRLIHCEGEGAGLAHAQRVMTETFGGEQP